MGAFDPQDSQKSISGLPARDLERGHFGSTKSLIA